MCGERGRACRRAIGLFLQILVLLLLATCQESEDSPICPTGPIGILEGFVLGGDAPVLQEVRAIPASGWQPSWQRFETRPDSTGWFSLELPAGGYQLAVVFGSKRVLYSDEGPAWFTSDTLLVSGRTRADIRGARLQLRVQVPETLDGRRLKLAVHDVLWGQDRGERLAYTAIATEGVLEALFPLLPAGSYVVRVEEDGREGGTWLPGTGDIDSATTIALEPEESEEIAVPLESVGRIRGIVRGSWQTLGLDPPRLEAFDLSGELASETEAEPDGSFDLLLWQARPIRILVTFEWRQKKWAGGWDIEDATIFDLGPGEEMEGVEIIESGIQAQLEWPGTLPGSYVYYELVDEQGRTVSDGGSGLNPLPIANLDPGAYRLHVRPGWGNWPPLPQWYDQADSIGAATPIVIEREGEVVGVTVRFIEGGKISGRVLRADGAPATGLYVYLARVGEGEEQRTQTSEWTATYAVMGLADGEYNIGAATLSGICWFPGTYNLEEATPISIRDHEVRSNVDWSLPE